MKMFVAAVAVVILLHVNGGRGCPGDERDSLLHFKASVFDPSDVQMLKSWHGFNCCEWNGIQCHPHTHHVVRLDLHNSEDSYYFGMPLSNLTGDVLSPLFNLQHLEHLDLSWNKFVGVEIPSGLSRLKSLRHLDLSWAGFSGDIPADMGNMSALHYLDLSTFNDLRMVDMRMWRGNMRDLRVLNLEWVHMSRVESKHELDNALSTMYSLVRLQMIGCFLSGEIPPSMANLTALEKLDLSFNMLRGPIPQFGVGPPLGGPFPLAYIDLSHNQLDGRIPPTIFTAFPNLRSVYLSDNQLTGSIPSPAGDLRYLQQLHLSSNALTGKIPTSLANISSLISLDLNNNKLSDKIPSFGRLVSMESLDLGNNKLEGEIPPNISNLSKLQNLYLQSNRLNGDLVVSHLDNLRRLVNLDISDNLLTVKFSPTWIPKFSLKTLGLRSCNMEGEFPTLLVTQFEVESLDLSKNSLAGNIPEWIWGFNTLYSLNLSHNHFAGVLPQHFNLLYLDLHSNNLQGQLPFLSDGLSLLDVSENQLTGSISIEFGEYDILEVLVLAKNHLNGSIPPSIACRIRYVDLSNNNFTGKIPACSYNSSRIEVLNLENNCLKGELPEQFANMPWLQTLKLGGNGLNSYIPSSLAYCKELEILDFSNNKMRGIIPNWIGHLSNLKVLILRSNRFQGTIPSEITTLLLLQILDLSSNRLSGVIPANISSLQALKNKTVGAEFFGITVNASNDPIYVEKEKIINKAKEMEFARSLALVKCIDLSNNNLAGEIPQSIGLLEGLIIFNISRNHMKGKIPNSLGKMVLLESLDLSHNQLSGNIPLDIQLLTFLGYLNLSHNNLSGRIPQGGQLDTFEASSFLNNSALCGIQLNTTCCGLHLNQSCPPSTNIDKMDEEEEENNIWWGVSLGLSYAVGFSIVIGVLCLTATWSTKCFQVMDNIIIYLFQRFRN